MHPVRLIYGVWLWQAMPTGEETDFILVSCAGALVADDEPASAAAVLSHKRKGEQALRHSGLGYTIVRPGPLLEEPGGYKALVFDQAGPAALGKTPQGCCSVHTHYGCSSASFCCKSSAPEADEVLDIRGAAAARKAVDSRAPCRNTSSGTAVT